MNFVTRRRFIQATAILGGAGVGLGAYACGIEPAMMLAVTSYSLTPLDWPAKLKLKIGVIADLHACEPWMGLDRIRHIAAATNSLGADMIVLLGDFHGGHNFVTSPVMPEQWAEALSSLKAPLGVHAILGNHDWWHGAIPSLKGDNGNSVRRALRNAGFSCLENDALRLVKDGQPFWLLGLGDQMAFRTSRTTTEGVDDLEGTLAKMQDDAPAILLAHEPWIFDRVPKRICLTLSGHTHGGQVNVPDWIGDRLRPVRMRHSRLVYGHIVEDGRHIVVSGGLGTSIAPIRFRRPPEIVEIDVCGPESAASS